MAVPVRPPAWPQAQATSAQTSVQAANVRPGRNDARLAAQKAFFEAALAGKIDVQVLATEEVGPSARAQRLSGAPTAGDGFPPPGSFINILV
jgi:hypothetical protein